MPCFEIQPFYFIVVDMPYTHFIQCFHTLVVQLLLLCRWNQWCRLDRLQIFSLWVWTIFDIVFCLNIVCMLKVHSMENKTVLKTAHTLTYVMEGTGICYFKKEKSMFIFNFSVSKNACLSSLYCVFWDCGFCTVNSEIMFGRFSQNKVCFWKCLSQIFVRKNSTISTSNLYVF